MRKLIWVCSVMMFTVQVAAAEPASSSNEKIALWISELEMDNFEVREGAAKNLVQAGYDAWGLLKNVVNDESAPTSRTLAAFIQSQIILHDPFKFTRDFLADAKILEVNLVAGCGALETQAIFKGYADHSTFSIGRRDSGGKMLWTNKEMPKLLDYSKSFDFEPISQRLKDLENLFKFEAIESGTLHDNSVYVVSGSPKGLDERQGRFAMWHHIGWNHHPEQVAKLLLYLDRKSKHLLKVELKLHGQDSLWMEFHGLKKIAIFND
jgi:hypothetical protein